MPDCEQNVKSHTAYTARTPGVLRCGAALLAALGLLACAPAPAPPPEIGLRNPTVTLAGTTRFEQGAFAGSWVTVACLGTCAARETYGVATDEVYLREVGENRTAYLQNGPGVLREMGGDSTLVIMWVDTGFRTAAIGDAQGRWAAVIDRSAKTSPDRLAAATEVLDFNGWDVAQLTRPGG